MTLPNKLTLLRMALTVPFTACLALGGTGLYVAALALALIAALTDLVDGIVARRRDSGSAFGRFADPLADKLFVAGALVTFAVVEHAPGTPLVPCWIALVVIWRELLVTALRAYAAHRGVEVPSSKLGKAKTLLQMTAVVAVVAFLAVRALVVEAGGAWSPELDRVCRIVYLSLVGLAALQSLVSGVDYLIRGRALIRSGLEAEE